MIARFINDRDGHTAIEYGMIAALICIGIIAALTSMGSSVEHMFADVLAGFLS
ncbi:MAG: Flp family type IVb pilin [Alphaproteobacteria bacterium]|nr:Flp family type IVb pilin [Alphaproteobacteria bacterium]